MPTPPAIAVALKQTTQAAHNAVEDIFSGLLFSKALKAEHYRQILAALHRLHFTIEQQLTAYGSAYQLAKSRSKLAWLEADIRNLEGGAPSDFCQETSTQSHAMASHYRLTSSAMAMGALYVTEGSSLGGAVISHRLQAHDWISPDILQYFIGYGPDRKHQWLTFLAKLAAYDKHHPEKKDDVCAGALRTFDLFKDVLSEIKEQTNI